MLWRIVWTMVSAIIGIIGLGSFGEDLAKWASWLAWVNTNSGRTALVFIAVALLLIAWDVPGRLLRKVKAPRTPDISSREIQQTALSGAGPIADKTLAAVVPDVPKGFLDFQVEGIKSAKQLASIMGELAKETRWIGSQLQTHTRRLRPNVAPEQAHKIASDAATDMDRYSGFLERTLGTLRATGSMFGESHIGYFTPLTITSERDKMEASELLEVIKTLLQSLRTSRESVGAFRSGTARLRELGVSQNVNRSSQRLMSALDNILAFLSTLDKTLVKLTRVISQKLRDS